MVKHNGILTSLQLNRNTPDYVRVAQLEHTKDKILTDGRRNGALAVKVRDRASDRVGFKKFAHLQCLRVKRFSSHLLIALPRQVNCRLQLNASQTLRVD